MSFGSSYRFETTREENGQPKIFWEEAREVRSKKKFNHKRREQKYPLRSKHHPDLNTINEPLVDERSKGGVNSEMKQKAGPRRKPAPDIDAEPVLSITEDQLARMLESIGQVSKSNPLRISIDKETHQITLEQAEQNKENSIQKDAGKKRKKKTTIKSTKENTSLSTSTSTSTSQPTKSSTSPRDSTDDVTQNGHHHVTGEEDGPDETSVGNHVAPDSGPVVDVQSAPDTESRAIKYLSLSEKKRLQWQLERGAEANIYNPWGKPGAGAPIITSEGDVLADYSTRKPQVQQEQILLVSPRSDFSPRNPDLVTSPRDKPETEIVMPTQALPDVPSAMRSSFAIGASAPDEGRYQSKRELEKKKWLSELDRQIQEKKQKQSQSQSVSAVKEDSSTPRPSNQPDADLSPATDARAPRSHPSVAPMPPTSYSEASAALSNVAPAGPTPAGDVYSSLTLPDLESKVLVSTFVRGQNALLDPYTKKEMEEKRKRHVEHQKAIQAQVEEKQRKKRESEELKLAEDLVEERRLQQERDHLTRQYQQEQIKQKRKQEEQAIRVQKLKEAMDEAESMARQEKHLKRLNHLQQHGHDVLLYQKNYEAKNTPRYTTVTSTLPHNTGTSNQPTDPTVEPTYVPGLDLSHRSGGYYDNNDRHHGYAVYTENRALTPSKHRPLITAMSDPEFESPRKEFGTQTFDLGDVRAALDDSTRGRKPRETSAGIEYQKDKLLDIKRSEKVKKVRVVSAKSAPSKTRAQKETNVKPIEKMKVVVEVKKPVPQLWNYQNRQHKKAKTQSEKDPNYYRRREASEQRRLLRAMELQAMVRANEDRTPARSRSRSFSPKTHNSHARCRSQSPGRENLVRRSRLDDYEYDQWARADKQQYSNRDNSDSHRERAKPQIKQKQPQQQQLPPAIKRPKSPPVPAVKNRLHDSNNIINNHGNHGIHGDNESARRHPDALGDQRGHYSDQLPSYAPVEDGEFIPFLRSSAFLDPAQSQRPLPVSRETTEVEQGRKAYAQNQKPGTFGSRMRHLQDTGLDTLLPPSNNGASKYIPLKKDPLVDPSLVTDHPTARQEMILQQLADIRKNLLLKQREIETCLSPTDLTASRT